MQPELTRKSEAAPEQDEQGGRTAPPHFPASARALTLPPSSFTAGLSHSFPASAERGTGSALLGPPPNRPGEMANIGPNHLHQSRLVGLTRFGFSVRTRPLGDPHTSTFSTQQGEAVRPRLGGSFSSNPVQPSSRSCAPEPQQEFPIPSVASLNLCWASFTPSHLVPVDLWTADRPAVLVLRGTAELILSSA